MLYSGKEACLHCIHGSDVSLYIECLYIYIYIYAQVNVSVLVTCSNSSTYHYSMATIVVVLVIAELCKVSCHDFMPAGCL